MVTFMWCVHVPNRNWMKTKFPLEISTFYFWAGLLATSAPPLTHASSGAGRRSKGILGRGYKTGSDMHDCGWIYLSLPYVPIRPPPKKTNPLDRGTMHCFGTWVMIQLHHMTLCCHFQEVPRGEGPLCYGFTPYGDSPLKEKKWEAQPPRAFSVNRVETERQSWAPIWHSTWGRCPSDITLVTPLILVNVWTMEEVRWVTV